MPAGQEEIDPTVEGQRTLQHLILIQFGGVVLKPCIQRPRHDTNLILTRRPRGKLNPHFLQNPGIIVGGSSELLVQEAEGLT